MTVIASKATTTTSRSPTSSFFRHWTCLGLADSFTASRPHAVQIGELPLVVWKSPQDGTLRAAINICKHMGSRLDAGTITPSGCLKCPYHGYEYTDSDTLGTVVEQEGKLFWAHDPVERTPPKIPYYHHRDYATSTVVIDMDASLRDSALNTVDIRHPEYVHRLGFGSAQPPQKIQNYVYQSRVGKAIGVGVGFDYPSNPVMQKINRQHALRSTLRSSMRNTTSNLHVFRYPAFTWSRVSFPEDNHLIISVHFLPLAPQKTRWFVTLCHNYNTSPLGVLFLQGLAKTILHQDSVQMQRQAAESALKSRMMFEHTFADETAVTKLHRMFEAYQYPGEAECLALYLESKKKL